MPERLAAGERICIDYHYGIAHELSDGDFMPMDLSPAKQGA